MNWSELPASVRDCLNVLTEAGHAAYPVGGCVRDLLLGRTPGDYDVATAARPEAVAGLFAHTVPTGLAHGTVTVLLGELSIEVTTFRREGGYADGRHPDAVDFSAGLTEDLSRRDFTVNAMALGPDGTIVDPFGGRTDLQNRLIRCVGDPDRRFGEDALRMLRGIRFAAQLGFELEGETWAAIQRNAAGAGRVSRERIRAELEKTLLSDRPEDAGRMIGAGLLDGLYAFPAVCDLSGLKMLPNTQYDRWWGFCAATGFPIAALPVERRLRRAVEHPEREMISALALSGGDLRALGLEGPAIGAAQRRLARHVLEKPEDNTAERLRELL